MLSQLSMGLATPLSCYVIIFNGNRQYHEDQRFKSSPRSQLPNKKQYFLKFFLFLHYLIFIYQIALF